MASIHIEPMHPYDLDEVLALEARAFPDPWTRAQFEAELNNPHAEILLARQGVTPQGGGAILGYIAYWHIVDEIQVLDVAVDPHVQRQGIGRRLIQMCVERAKRENVVELMAITASEKLFSEVGFQYTLPDLKRALFVKP